ncbi:MAG: HD domain-containing protein [Desulfovibrio sp.]|jgi:HD superfamily phosphodiesterase|nr:HD domain-containing protein [Desulfovibrio sp.]
MEKHRSAFLEYTRSFFSGDPEKDRYMQLKVDHTFRVCSHAAMLTAEENELRAPAVGRALSLAALYHDVGRFEQLKRWNTFSDAQSCNHGLLGASVLKKQGFLDNEDREVRHRTIAAVALHNRFALPAALRGDLLRIVAAVRDADKVDILRILAEQLGPGSAADNTMLMHLKDAPGICSPAILKALREKRVARYMDMRTLDDFRLLLCTWLFDLRFNASLRAIRENGCFISILDGFTGAPDVKAEAAAVVENRLNAPSSTLPA